MSVKQMVKVWEHEFPHPQQAVMLALADHADDEGRRIYPSMDYLAWKTGYTRRGVQNIMSELRRSGVLVITREANRYSPNEYRLDWTQAVPKKAFVRDEKFAPLEDDQGCTDGAAEVQTPCARGEAAVQQGCTDGAAGVNPSSPKPSYNHQRTIKEPKSTSPPKTGGGARAKLLEVYNTHRGKLPSVKILSKKRQRQLARLVNEFGAEGAEALLADATRCVATDPFWLERRYNLDNLLASEKVVEKAEKYRAGTQQGEATPKPRLQSTEEVMREAMGDEMYDDFVRSER